MTNNVAGWVADPTERGTLTLIWSCVLTIFACTWTVLHLNIPGREDRTLQRSLRKIKWMVLNILFPEFILSKAICDLLLAIQELQEFREKCEKFKKMNKKIVWTEKYEKVESTPWGLRLSQWSWNVAPLPPLLISMSQFISRGHSRTLVSPFPRSHLNSLHFEMEASRSSAVTADSQEVREQANRQLETRLVPEDHDRMSCQPGNTSHSDTGAFLPEGREQQPPKAKPRTDIQHDSLGDLTLHRQLEQQKQSDELRQRLLEQHRLNPGMRRGEQDSSGQGGQREGGEDKQELQHYQTQLRLLEQQNKKRLEMKSEMKDGSGLSSMQVPSEGSHGCRGTNPTEEFTAPTLDPRSIKQEWTLSHSYYAQMGGLLYHDASKPWPNERVFTASYLTSRHTWDWENGGTDEHPLMHLVLGKEDIEDKSKAEYLSKGLAVLQGMWFVLNVIARHVTGLFITPIEIATVAFSIMAVFIYLANWWKPKDVFRSTNLRFKNLKPVYSESQLHDRRRSFVGWLFNPELRSQGFESRVQNDVVCLEGDTPLFLYLMGASSLIFGGLHCLAWNYEFPTQAEVYCWRIASLVSAVLPVVALVFSAFVVYLAGSSPDHQIRSTMLNELRQFEPLRQLTTEWWENFTEIGNRHRHWEPDAQIAFFSMAKESRNWEEEPAADIVTQSKRNRGEWRKAQGELSKFIFIHSYLETFQECWVYASQERNDDPYRLRTLWARVGELLEEESRTDSGASLDFWRDFEEMLSNKSGIPQFASVNDKHSYLEQIVQAFSNAKEVFGRTEAFSKRWSRVSRVITIVSVIIYATARIIIMILLFTSFRAAPTGVYQNTVWTRFLPNIS